MVSRDSKSASLTIACNGAEAVHRLTEAAQRFGIDHALARDRTARLSILVEELVVNLVEHGGIGEGELIELVLTLEDGVVAISLSDGGPAFDPRGMQPGETIPERGGGAGLELVKAWADIVDYQSDNGRNRLRLRMWLA